MLKQMKSSSGSYRYLTHTTDKNPMMERRTDMKLQKLLVAEYETDVYGITGEDLELVVTKEQYVPVDLMKRYKHLQSSYREILMSWSRISTKIPTNASDRISH